MDRRNLQEGQSISAENDSLAQSIRILSQHTETVEEFDATTGRLIRRTSRSKNRRHESVEHNATDVAQSLPTEVETTDQKVLTQTASQTLQESSKASRDVRRFPEKSSKTFADLNTTCDVMLPYHEAVLPYVDEAVRSILHQTLWGHGHGVTLHLIADDLPPEQDPIRKKYEVLPGVKTYYTTQSLGPYVACLQIFDRLQGEFLAIMDGDDIALPHRLEYSIRALRKSDADIFGGSMLQFVDYRNQGPEQVERWKNTPVHRSVNDGKRIVVVNCTMIIRRSVFEQLNGFRDFYCGADIQFIPRAQAAGYAIYCSEEIVGLRRLVSSSLSNNEKTGFGSAARKKIVAQQKEDLAEMQAGVEPSGLGSLDKHRHGKQLLSNNLKKVEIPNLEIHVTHACNLACQSCSHFSDLKVGTNVSLKSLGEQMRFWSHRIAPKQFSILGGEPALHPNLPDIVRECRRQWPEAKLILVSNGFLLNKHPSLPAALEETNCQLHISIHHDGDEYTEKFQSVKSLLNHWQQDASFRIDFRQSAGKWRKVFAGEGANIRPRTDNDPQKSWQICVSKYCPQIFEGKLWKCPPIAYLQLMDRKFPLSDDWKPYLRYEPLDPFCTTSDLEQFFSRETESICSMCPANMELFELPSPLRS